MKRANSSVLALAAAVVLSAWASVASATDGPIVQNPNNGHFYQRIDTALTWYSAQNNCIAKGATLATMTTADESAFVWQALGMPNNADYYFGAQDFDGDGKYQWVTGELFAYSHWGSAPSAGGVARMYGGNGNWYADGGTGGRGSICEWSNSNFTATGVIADTNANGASELASLGIDPVAGKYIVSIKDLSTKKKVRVITYTPAATTPPGGMAVMDDMNGNGSNEIAVLYLDSVSQLPKVEIRDSKTAAVIKTITFLSNAYIPTAITVSADQNGNGSQEITVLGVNRTTSAFTAEMRDSATGALIQSLTP